MTATRVLLVRHGQSTWNAEGRWQGWADAPLSPLGEQQARAAAQHLPEVDALCASDLRRAIRTAELLAERKGLPPASIYRGLRERSVGEFEGLTNAEIADRYPHLWKADGKSLGEIPGSEPVASLVSRTVAALVRVAEEHQGRRVLAVSHGGVIRNLERHLGEEPRPLPNLGGRWFEINGVGAVRPVGERVLLYQPSEATVTVPGQL